MALDNLHPPKRAHVAEHVFDQLARAILEGELPPNTAAPPERVLVERFGVSRIIVRQAMHRLAELGLVRVRQGGATLIVDPNEVADPRILALFYRLTKQGGRRPQDVADIIEKQYLQGLSIVEIASRRADRAELERIALIVDAADKNERDLADPSAFEERFWRALGAACKNRVLKIEVTWWYDALTDRPVPREVSSADPHVRIEFYRELTRRLLKQDYPVEYYLAITRPLLTAVLARASGEGAAGAGP